MNLERFQRTKALIGEEALERLSSCCVAIFGVGGVGSYAAEAVARCGVGKIILVDADTVSKSNINRQIIALSSTVGRPKVEVAKERILDINPKAQVLTYDLFYSEETEKSVELCGVSFIIDAIDSVSSKVLLIKKAQELSIPIISCMGTGNKLCPEMLEITDIYKTQGCPLAKVLRQKLKKEGISSLPVVYSKESARKPILSDEESFDGPKRVPIASISFVPSSAGLLAASYCIKKIAKI